MAAVLLPPVPNTIKVRWVSSAPSIAPWSTSMHFGYTGGPITEVGAVEIAALMGASWVTSFNPQLCNTVILDLVEVTDLSVANGARGIAPIALAGQDVDKPMPYGSCVVISEHTSRRYRGGHARVYISGIPQTSVAGDSLHDDALSSMQTAAESFESSAEAIATGGVTGLGLVAVSYFSGFTVVTEANGRTRNVPKVSAAPRVDGVTALLAHRTLGSQRRRNHYA